MNNSLVELRHQEEIIQEGIESFVSVGQALLYIKKHELYKLDGWTKFDDYCAGRWPQLPKSTRYYQMEVAEVKEILGQDLKNAHAIEIYRHVRDDEELIEKTWADVNQQLPPEKITASVVRTFAKKNWLIKNGGPLGEAVQEQKVSTEKAYNLQKVLSKLPDKYTLATIQYGIGEDCVSGDTLYAIQSLSYQDSGAADEILLSGYLEDVPLWQLTPQDVSRYQKRLLYEEQQSRILNAIEKQKETMDNENARIFDSVGSWRLENESLLYFIFANGSIEADEILNFVKNNNLKVFFVSVYDPANPPSINFDGVPVEPKDIRVKPANLINYIKDSTL